MKYIFTLCFLTLTSLSLLAQEKEIKKSIPYTIDSKDVVTIDGIIAALYDVISGPAAAPRNWERMKALFKPDARLSATGKSPKGEVYWVSMTVDDYIERNSPHFEKNGFFETEIYRKTDTFGQISQIFSTYEARFEEDGVVKMRGINSIQVTYDSERYWIANILWNGESPDQPIPTAYLKKS